NKFSQEFIKEGTLTNGTIIGSTKREAYVGGTNIMIINSNRSNHIIGDPEGTKFYLNATIDVDLVSLAEGTFVDVYIRPNDIENRLPEGMTLLNSDSLAYYTLVGSIDEPGLHSFNTADLTIDTNSDVFGTLVLVFRAAPNARVEFASIT